MSHTYETNKVLMARRATERTAELARVRAGIIDRDPCTFCGVRAEVGCKHKKLAA